MQHVPPVVGRRPRPGHRRLLGALLAATLLLAACTADTAPDDPAPDDPAPEGDDQAADGGADDDGADEEATADEPEPVEDCDVDLPDEPVVRVPGDLAGATELVAATASCAATVVLVADDAAAAAAAVSVALAEDAVLVVTDGRAPASVDELGAQRVVTVGPVGEIDLPGETTLETIDVETSAAADVATALDAATFVTWSTEDPHGLAHALAHAAADTVVLPVDPQDVATSVSPLPAGATVLVPSTTADADAVLDALDGAGVASSSVEHPGSDASATTWLLDSTAGPTAAVATVTAARRGEQRYAVDGEDLRLDRGAIGPLAAGAPDRVVLVGDVTEDADWQLETVRSGTPLPWGGFSLFDDERMVALYGSPETSVLGALGEQDLDATVARLREVAEPYGADGATVRPAFEIISTIASAEAGTQGDYSRRTPIETIRPWVDRAAEEDIYVLLDLQPGRTDFLTQAQEYEELLREPHVGLALDPEWRLEPDQVHLRQIGSVSAAEVQQVADWLAALTREAGLPEKLLVLHQFRFSMLPDREEIVAPPELAVVVHMDGQGPIGTKYETYAAITAGHEDRWLWGWKNFYDEDSPTPTPAEVLALDPLPVFVSYQ